MKVLILSSFDLNGGAAVVAYRHHRGMKRIGIDSKLLVQEKRSVEKEVIGPNSKKAKLYAQINPHLDKIPLSIYKNKEDSIFSTSLLSLTNITRAIKEIDPDVIHLHWINGGFVTLSQLSKIKKPIVWSLLDMWPFTGGCHYDNDCLKYTTGCGMCPQLNSNKRDISGYIIQKKIRCYKNIEKLIIVGHSKWITESARQSVVFKGREIVNIPSSIDTEEFNMLNKLEARRVLGVPEQKKIILYGAMSSTSDKRKGHHELQRAMGLLKTPNVYSIIFGNTLDVGTNDSNSKILGPLYDTTSLKLLYNAADVTIVPSLQENFSNVILESLSCGTPVVAFNIGGNSDMIMHKNNGYLAEPTNITDLAAGIDWVLQYANQEELRINSNMKVKQNYELCKISNRYLELYESIIK